MRVLELADRLRHYGLPVIELAGWHTRGYEFPTRPDGALRHWTAGSLSSDTSSLGIVTHGRSDLPGPLCNVYQSRRVDPATGLDIVYVIASGKANHAGTGSWNGITGNYKLLGLEIEWSGPNEEFEGVRNRKLTSELVMRALMDCCAGTNDNDACEHREYAPRRKIDTNLSGDELRRRMSELRTGSVPTPIPVPPPPPPPPPPTALEYAMDTLDLRNAHAVPVRGRHVDNLQALLIATWQVVIGVRPHIAGMYVGGGYALPDGVAGFHTKEALLAFQRHVGLTADAVCGPKTWKRLIEF